MRTRVYAADRIRLEQLAAKLGVSRSELARQALSRFISGEFVPEGSDEPVDNATYVVPHEQEMAVRELVQTLGVALDRTVREALRSFLDLMERKEALQSRQEALTTRQEALVAKQEEQPARRTKDVGLKPCTTEDNGSRH